MKYDFDCWLSRGVVAVAFALIAAFVAQGVYGRIGAQDMLAMWGLFAVGFYGIVPKYVANWVFGFLIIALLCTLAIMFPVHLIAILCVFGALFAFIGAMA